MTCDDDNSDDDFILVFFLTPLNYQNILTVLHLEILTIILGAVNNKCCRLVKNKNYIEHIMICLLQVEVREEIV